MERKNCWEFMQCGLEPGGIKAEENGVCPTAMKGPYDGTNNGLHAGRFCWALKGTISECKKEGTKEEQLMRCINCDFMKSVHDEEGDDFVLLPEGVDFFM